MQINTKVAAVGGAALIVLGLMLVAKPAITAVYSTPVRDVDLAARQPVTARCNTLLIAGALESSCVVFTVPAGNRLVIDTISTSVSTPPGGRAKLSLSHGSGAFFLPQVWAAFDGTEDYGEGSSAVQIYVEPGENVLFVMDRSISAPTGMVLGSLVFSGHLVSLP